MTPSLNLDVVKDSIMQTLLSLLNDPIPNIRFNVAKALEVIGTTYGSTPEGKALVKEKIVPALQSLQNDADADVRYFSNRALQYSKEKAGITGMSCVRSKIHAYANA